MRKSCFAVLFLFFLAADVYSFEGRDTVSIYGCVAQGYMKSDANNYLLESEDGSFQMREILLTFSSQMSHKLHVGAQIAALDLGDVGNNDPILDWAFGDYQYSELFGMRAGRIKGAGIGFYNETQDIDLVRTSIFLPPSVYSPLLRDSQLALDGICLYGGRNLPYIGNVSYSFSLGTTSLKEDGMTRKYFESFGLIKNSEIHIENTSLASIVWMLPFADIRCGASYLNSGISLEGNQTVHPDWFLEFNILDLIINLDLMNLISKSNGEAITLEQLRDHSGDRASYEENPREMYIYSFEFLYENLTIASEYMNTKNHRKLSLENRNVSVEQTINPVGGYISTAYRFAEWLEISLRYEQFYKDNDDKDGKKYLAKYREIQKIGMERSPHPELIETFMQNPPFDFEFWQHMTTFTARFDVADSVVAKIEYSLVNGTALLLPHDNLNRNELEENWNIAAAKVIFAF